MNSDRILCDSFAKQVSESRQGLLETVRAIVFAKLRLAKLTCDIVSVIGNEIQQIRITSFMTRVLLGFGSWVSFRVRDFGGQMTKGTWGMSWR